MFENENSNIPAEELAEGTPEENEEFSEEEEEMETDEEQPEDEEEQVDNPQEAEDNLEDDGSEEDVEDSDEDVIPILYGDKTFNLTREEAAGLSVKGKMFEENEDVFDTLEYISERTGDSVKDIVNSILSAIDRKDLDDAIASADGDTYEGNRLFEERRSNARKSLDDRKAQRNKASNLKEHREEQIAQDFEKYGEEMGYKTINDIPKAVIDSAVNNNISLFDAYLRFKHSEDKKVNANRKKQTENANKSTGSLKSNGGDDDYSSLSKILLDA